MRDFLSGHLPVAGRQRLGDRPGPAATRSGSTRPHPCQLCNLGRAQFLLHSLGRHRRRLHPCGRGPPRPPGRSRDDSPAQRGPPLAVPRGHRPSRAGRRRRECPRPARQHPSARCVGQPDLPAFPRAPVSTGPPSRNSSARAPTCWRATIAARWPTRPAASTGPRRCSVGRRDLRVVRPVPGAGRGSEYRGLLRQHRPASRCGPPGSGDYHVCC